MENQVNLFDTIMQNCPYLKGLIENKIAEEVGKKDSEIEMLKGELSLATERVTFTEDAINMILEVM